MKTFKKKRKHLARERALVGLLFLLAFLAIVFMLHQLWDALTNPGY